MVLVVVLWFVFIKCYFVIVRDKVIYIYFNIREILCMKVFWDLFLNKNVLILFWIFFLVNLFLFLFFVVNKMFKKLRYCLCDKFLFFFWFERDYVW